MANEFIFDSDDFVTFCSDFDANPVSDLTDSLLEVNLQDLNDRWANVQKSYKTVCMQTDKGSDQDFVDSARGKYAACTKSYHKCKSKILDLQKTMVSPPLPSSADLQVPDSSFDCIKLPPCDTDDFHGSYEEWPSFRDMFTAVYVDHPKLSAVQKLYHLRLKVKGQAAGIVRKYKLCGENFSLAWEALKARYENKRILVDNQLKILLSLESVNSESSKSLQAIQTTINDCLAALKAQEISTKDWDPILVYLCSTKLPHETLSLWEQSLKSHRELPKWSEMDCFLSNRYEVVERLDSIHGAKANSRRKQGGEVNVFVAQTSPQIPCKMCTENHALRSCPQFLEMNPSERNQFVSQNKLCLNCLSHNHLRKDCKSKYTCSQCKRNHHSLLHFPTSSLRNRQNTSSSTNQNSTTQDQDEVASASYQAGRSEVLQTASHFGSSDSRLSTESTLLPTAMVTIYIRGDTFSARAFLDQGSEKSFISNRLQQKLALPVEYRKFQVQGIGGQIVANSNSLCHFTLVSASHEQQINVKAVVVPKITRFLPNFFVPKTAFSMDELTGIELADPEFHCPGQIDLLLGSNVIPMILLDGVKKLCGSLVAQATIFGWVLSGPVFTEAVSSFSLQAVEQSDDLISSQLKAFWEQEEVPQRTSLTSDDQYCETLYKTTTYRNEDGRYVVKLPFRPNYGQDLLLGLSRTQALMQYIRMEKTLAKNPDLSKTYNDVLQEYVDLGHMQSTSADEFSRRGTYNTFYLPHHAVVKPQSRSTKVRVVFNA